MFKRGNKKVTAEGHDLLNRLVATTKITGDLITESSLRIDGEVSGNVNCKGRFVLGVEGKVYGNITAVEVELNGRIEGQIKAHELLILQKTAVVVGDIKTKRIIIEDGAQLSGNIQTKNIEDHSSSINETENKNMHIPLEVDHS